MFQMLLEDHSRKRIQKGGPAGLGTRSELAENGFKTFRAGQGQFIEGDYSVL